MKKLSLLIGLLALFSIALPASAAKNLDNLGALSQSQFKLLSEDLGSSLSYKAIIPAESTGLKGIDIGFEVTGTDLVHSNIWASANTTGSAPSTLYIPKVHIHKGLPFRIDLGFFVGEIPSTDMKINGFEVRYGIVKGGTIKPAVGIRATYTKLSGDNNLDLTTKGLELSISKGFTVITPYAGIGVIRTVSKPNASTGLANETFNQTKTYIGANFNLGILNIATEVDKTGDAKTVALKFGWRF